MSDNYQAVYDAVRSKFHTPDIEGAVRMALADVPYHFAQAAETIKQAAWEAALPSAIYRPTLTVDGNKWCALYGANLQEGVAGFGDSPASAMQAFNDAWHAKLPIAGEKGAQP